MTPAFTPEQIIGITVIHGHGEIRNLANIAPDRVWPDHLRYAARVIRQCSLFKSKDSLREARLLMGLAARLEREKP